jgi:hypothetical protein
MTTEELEKAHKHSFKNKEEIDKSKTFGCFQCLKKSTLIEEWADGQQTALCPHCGIDSVIGDESGYPVEDSKFLRQMFDHYFG